MPSTITRHPSNNRQQWKAAIANSNLIQAETDRAVLIKLPKSERKFWHPKKLVRQSGKGGYRLKISYTDEFEFKVFRTGKNRQILEERTISPEEFEKYFNAG